MSPPQGPQFQQPYGAMPPADAYPPDPRLYGRPDSRDLVITLLLWFFLGGLGAHRLYLGQTGTGIAMLCMSVLGFLTTCIIIGYIPIAIVGIWVIVDLILILTGNLKFKDGRRLL